jgi:DNA invertase Pin-like site-specific DNA recombinase
MTDKPIRYVGYIRVSSDEQEERGFSLDEQRDTVSAVAAKLPGFVGPLHIFGGSESALKEQPRPQFEQMLAQVEAGRVGAIIVTDKDRLWRRDKDRIRVYEVCRRRNVAIYVRNHHLNLRDRHAAFADSVETQAKELDQDDRFDKIIRGRVRRAALGFHSSSLPPFGRFVKKQVVGKNPCFETDSKTGEAVWRIDPKAKRYVEKAAKLYLQGQPWEVVAERVQWPNDKAGTPLSHRANTLRRRVLEAGAEWEQSFKMGQVLTEEDFAGYANRDRITVRDQVAYVRTPVPALLPADVIEKVSARAAMWQIDRRTPNVYALSRFVQCSECGSALSIHTHANGKAYLQHHSKTRKANCPGAFGQYGPLEDGVLYQLSQVLKDEPRMMQAVRTAFEAEVPNLQELRAQRDEAEQDLAGYIAQQTRLRGNLLGTDLSDEDKAAMGEVSRRLSADVARVRARLDDLDRQQSAAQVPVDVEAQVRGTVKRIREGYLLLHSSRDKQRLAVRSLFGERPVRNRPANAKTPAPPYGVFVRWQLDRDLGERIVVWEARGAFFAAGGAITSVPDIYDKYAGGSGSGPASQEIGSTKIHAWQPGGTRWSASACRGTVPRARAGGSARPGTAP